METLILEKIAELEAGLAELKKMVAGNEATEVNEPQVVEVKKVDYSDVNSKFGKILDYLAQHKDNEDNGVKQALAVLQKMIDEDVLSFKQVNAAKIFINNRIHNQQPKQEYKGYNMNFKRVERKVDFDLPF